MLPPLSEHRAALSNTWNRNEQVILAVLKNGAALNAKDLDQAYRETILGLVRIDSLQLPIQEQLMYFEQVTECVRLQLCDSGVATAALQQRAREFFNQFYPYICALRADWQDPTIGEALERFVRSRSPLADVCRS
jgi:hypothetical protein